MSSVCPSGLKRVSLGHHDATAFDDSYCDSFLVTQMNRTGSDRYPTNLSIDEDFCNATIVCNRITAIFRGDTLVRRHKLVQHKVLSSIWVLRYLYCKLVIVSETTDQVTRVIKNGPILDFVTIVSMICVFHIQYSCLDNSLPKTYVNSFKCNDFCYVYFSKRIPQLSFVNSFLEGVLL
jgi:hypothetical protein